MSTTIIDFLGANGRSELVNDIARACFEKIFGPDSTFEGITSTEVFAAFEELLSDVQDHESSEYDDEALEDKRQRILDDLAVLLKEEFSAQGGKFARLLNGQVKQSNRRHIQSSFNREKSFPFVLIAQSVVGREGLNLHKQCKTVFMLHPEWNPAVAEQQVGRVDRLQCLWAKLVKAIADGSEVPFIEYRPVVFKHTYDEEHWRVLRRRWDDNKAQLHGIIIPVKEGRTEHQKQIIEKNK